MTDAHAEYAPSSMYLTVACPGWKRQAALLPPAPDTEAVIEGHKAHAVAASMAKGVIPDVDGDNVTQEMIDCGFLWVEALERFPALLESRVQVTRVHPTKCWGTPDAQQVHIGTDEIRVRVADYKFGHEFVDEFENWQMLCYAVGIVDEIYKRPDESIPPGITVEITVVQPRYYSAEPIRTWTIKSAGLQHYAERMRAAVREAESDYPRIISGTHCMHCPARATCSTFAKTVGHAIDFTGRPDPMVSTPEQVGLELRVVQEFLKRLEARETGLAAMAESMIRSGKRVPGYKLEPSQGRLRWTASVEEIEFLARLRGKSALKPPELITPMQARDRKIIDASVIDEYAERPPGALKLVPTADTAKRMFK